MTMTNGAVYRGDTEMMNLLQKDSCLRKITAICTSLAELLFVLLLRLLLLLLWAQRTQSNQQLKGHNGRVLIIITQSEGSVRRMMDGNKLPGLAVVQIY